MPNEVRDDETRVALVPAVVKKLAGENVQIVVESGAGQRAGAPDAEYEEAGATIASDEAAVWREADVVLRVTPPTAEQVRAMKSGAMLIGSLAPLAHPELVAALREAGVTALACEFIPRISRAQAMDTLSSQANIGGYKAVILGADSCAKMFPMMITAAGTLRPARVFVLGAGVAGLQAIATAKRLGAIVEAYDVRPATKEQVQSLDARFVELPSEGGADAETSGGYAKEQSEEQQKKQAELMAKHVVGADVVVCTAAVFGKAPPLLVPGDVAQRMGAGTVLVDIAAAPEHGRGNCELTEPGQIITTENGATIVGLLNLPARVPNHASLAYANNMQALLKTLIEDGQIKLNLEDQVHDGACIVHNGEVRNELVREAVNA
ncbi:MAG: Re/Si-specific NAD(P)(+) transhydrogenase subunit alpha [Phycisphaeraceae bacterium]